MHLNHLTNTFIRIILVATLSIWGAWGLISRSQAQTSNDSFFQDADQFLKNYVSMGKVDYQSIKQKNASLIKLVDQIKQFNLEGRSKNEQKAFYINAYNLLVIKQVVDHYPISGPMEVTGFFKTTKFEVAGKSITLDFLENDILRKEHSDPRLHFVLVCGAVSCPKIASGAVLPESIEQTLNSQTGNSINDQSFVYEKDNNIYLSEIFNWFKEDFGDPIAFINKYRSKDFGSLPVKYYKYDWTLNDIQKSSTNATNNVGSIGPTQSGGQTYNPGTLLKKGQMDLTLFSSIYTESKSNWQGQDFSGFRNTFAGSLIQFTYGTSKNSRINAGLDLNFRNTGSSGDSTFGGLIEGLAFKNSVSSRAGLASIAPKIKLSPFKNNNNLTIQSQFIYVLPKVAEGNGADRYWIEWDRHMWWTQFFYSKLFAGNKFQFFGEADALVRFKRRSNQGTHFDIPLSAFLSYFPNRRTTFYIMTQHTQRLADGTDTDWVINANFTASGAGFKYQLNPRLQMEMLYTNFWRGQNSGLGATYNLGLKYIR